MEKINILIVEDETIVALDIESRMKKLGHSVCGIVTTGQAAIDKATEKRPDLVLMDIQLKGSISGVEAAKQIYTHLEIPIIYLTANADVDTFNTAKTTEPLGYILKPFKDKELSYTIELTLAQYRAQKKFKESAQWLVNVLQSIADAVITTDLNGRVTFMNSAAEVLTGWQQSNVYDKHVTEIFPSFHGDTNSILESPVFKTQPHDFMVSLLEKTIFVTKNSTKIPIRYNGAPIKDNAGKITGTVWVLQEIAAS
jgi:PAS domain S-box-containing protein